MLVPQARDIMDRNKCILFAPKDTIDQAIHYMDDMDYDVLPVIEDKKIIGMLTRRELFKKLESFIDVSAANIREAVSRKFVFCYDSDKLDRVASLMGKHHLAQIIVLNKNHLAQIIVLNKNHEILGMVTVQSLLGAVKDPVNYRSILRQLLPNGTKQVIESMQKRREAKVA